VNFAMSSHSAANFRNRSVALIGEPRAIGRPIKQNSDPSKRFRPKGDQILAYPNHSTWHATHKTTMDNTATKRLNVVSSLRSKPD
jgi:hypothetical protein